MRSSVLSEEDSRTMFALIKWQLCGFMLSLKSAWQKWLKSLSPNSGRAKTYPLITWWPQVFSHSCLLSTNLWVALQGVPLVSQVPPPLGGFWRLVTHGLSCVFLLHRGFTGLVTPASRLLHIHLPSCVSFHVVVKVSVEVSCCPLKGICVWECT